MSLYIDFKVAAKHANVETIAMEWCKVDQVLAIATANNTIQFYQEEGELVDEEGLHHECRPRTLNWRPTSKVLASGWEDGTVSLWNVKDRVEKEDRSVHSNPITVLNWSPEGARLIGGDSHGLISVWKTDHRRRLAVVCKHQITGDDGFVEPILSSAWVITPEYRDAQSDLATPPQYFFVGTEKGTIELLDLKGQVAASAKESSPVSHMLWYEEKQRLVVISADCVLSQYEIEFAERNHVKLNLFSRVKLSMTAAAVKEGVLGVCWVAPGLLATCAAEHMVRFWDLEHDENYMVSLSSMHEHQGIQRKDHVTRIAYNSRKKLMSVGTNSGKSLLWRFVGDSGGDVVEDDLEENGKEDKENDVEEKQGGRTGSQNSLLRGKSTRSNTTKSITTITTKRPVSTNNDWKGINLLQNTGDPIEFVCWGPGEAIIGISTRYQSSVFCEAVLHRTLRKDVAAVQVSAQRVLIRRGASIEIDHTVGIRIKGIDINESHLVVWNRKNAEIYQLSSDRIQLISSFLTRAESIALHGQSIFQTVNNKLEVCNLQGVSTKVITFTEQEGNPRLLDVNGKHLAVATSKGFIKLFDVSRRDPKPVGTGKRFTANGSKKLLGEIRSIRCNADGTRVSILCDRSRGTFLCEPDTRFHVWYPDMDEIKHYEFGPTRYPVSHFWDGHEPRLFACEATRTGRSSRQQNGLKLSTGGGQNAGSDRLSNLGSEVQVFTLFATDEKDKGIMMQDSFPLDRGLDALLGLRVPRLLFITKPLEENRGLPKLKGRTMRDFVGLDSRLDEETKKALINFSYFLAVGNMDEAYRAVKLIQNVAVWENMAHMCVKTKRLDVAEVCLGNMGHARGARALRQAKKEPEVEARIAMVAVQLGLLDDAERLYVECGRYDLLNKMYQASGQWEKALEVANQMDRIHLRETHFKYARFLESLEDTNAAIKNYEASDTHKRQVPRMLFSHDRLDELDGYTQSTNDPELARWLGQYCESMGDYERAIHTYTRAGDELSLVRVYCCLDNVDAASDVALNATNPAASYFLARHCEQMGDIKAAIQFFSRAGRFNHAVRLARENEMDSEILNHALRASPAIMIEAAKYLEMKGLNESAVLLYQKGGNVPRALDLCFRAQLFDHLRSIADSLSDGSSDVETYSSPEILSRCAEFFIEHKQFEKAVHLLITGKEFEHALELCMNNKVTITEDMAERLTLEKISKSSAVAKSGAMSAAKIAEHEARRQNLLVLLAKCCKKQGSYHLATKKFTQAGDLLKAMKCLLKSGDTEKIIFFAGVSKRPEIYILAANYLQNLAWHNNPETMKNIITFYTKAKAFHQLSNFYDACAQVEIDEYKDYDKALGALKESAKYLKKATFDNKDVALDSINERISFVERFVHARECSKKDPEETEKICQSLLAHPNIESSVRMGDVFALLVEFYYSHQDNEQAHQLIERMRDREIPLGPYLDRGMVEAVYRSQNADIDFDEDGVKGGDVDDDEDDIEEEIFGGSHK